MRRAAGASPLRARIAGRARARPRLPPPLPPARVALLGLGVAVRDALVVVGRGAPGKLGFGFGFGFGFGLAHGSGYGSRLEPRLEQL